MGAIIRADTGPVILQVRTGATPDEPPTTIYLTANWELVPATNLTRLLGPRGTPVGVVPFVGEQMINLEVTGETSRQIEAGRLLGGSTFSAAAAAPATHLLSAFLTGSGGLEDRAGLVSALAAMGGGSLATDAPESVYELRLEVTAAGAASMRPEASGTLYRISPIPTLVSDTTGVFNMALDDMDFASFYTTGTTAAVGDTANIIFSVDGASHGAVEMTWDNPQVPITKIVAMSGREAGNAFAYVEADNCVPIDPTFRQERGSVTGIPTQFLVLGATARFRQVDYTEALAAVAGIA